MIAFKGANLPEEARHQMSNVVEPSVILIIIRRRDAAQFIFRLTVTLQYIHDVETTQLSEVVSIKLLLRVATRLEEVRWLWACWEPWLIHAFIGDVQNCLSS